MRCGRSIGTLSRWAGQSAQAPISRERASSSSTRRRALLRPPNLAPQRSTRSSRSRRPAVATPSLEAESRWAHGVSRRCRAGSRLLALGCAGGVSGFSIASRLACSRPGSIVLLVAVEVCTLAFRLDELTKSNIVATRRCSGTARPRACSRLLRDGGRRPPIAG